MHGFLWMAGLALAMQWSLSGAVVTTTTKAPCGSDTWKPVEDEDICVASRHVGDVLSGSDARSAYSCRSGIYLYRGGTNTVPTAFCAPSTVHLSSGQTIGGLPAATTVSELTFVTTSISTASPLYTTHSGLTKTSPFSGNDILICNPSAATEDHHQAFSVFVTWAIVTKLGVTSTATIHHTMRVVCQDDSTQHNDFSWSIEAFEPDQYNVTYDDDDVNTPPEHEFAPGAYLTGTTFVFKFNNPAARLYADNVTPEKRGTIPTWAAITLWLGTGDTDAEFDFWCTPDIGLSRYFASERRIVMFPGFPARPQRAECRLTLKANDVDAFFFNVILYNVTNQAIPIDSVITNGASLSTTQFNERLTKKFPEYFPFVGCIPDTRVDDAVKAEKPSESGVAHIHWEDMVDVHKSADKAKQDRRIWSSRGVEFQPTTVDLENMISRAFTNRIRCVLKNKKTTKLDDDGLLTVYFKIPTKQVVVGKAVENKFEADDPFVKGSYMIFIDDEDHPTMDAPVQAQPSDKDGFQIMFKAPPKERYVLAVGARGHWPPLTAFDRGFYSSPYVYDYTGKNTGPEPIARIPVSTLGYDTTHLRKVIEFPEGVFYGFLAMGLFVTVIGYIVYGWVKYHHRRDFIQSQNSETDPTNSRAPLHTIPKLTTNQRVVRKTSSYA